MSLRKEKNLLIDLDETVISTVDIEDYKPEYDNFKPYKMDDFYSVFQRPGLQEFLNYAFDNFNVSIFTASSQSYALAIIKNIIIGNKKDRKLDYIFFSHHCDITKKLKNGIKDLTVLWDNFKLPGYNKDNTIIIDDNDEVAKTGYCIQVKEYNFNGKESEKENYLNGELRDKLEEFRLS
jgi:TFIIF-interacting CTD phosphatase-like protein